MRERTVGRCRLCDEYELTLIKGQVETDIIVASKIGLYEFLRFIASKLRTTAVVFLFVVKPPR